ncbi:MAG: molybdopterin-synthase adenylyltransferase MoeB [Beggiatoa sp. IS2]|nr:MAG: molybdopterin-synthase adenylyltransferase MoeB [Beggiatoa sp. IS2]
MDDSQLLRYSRQILLPQIEFAGQQKLAHATVLVVGLGGLGSPVAMYLAASGVGHLLLADFDRVDLPNLQRQIVHDTAHIGQLKVESARATLHALNPEIQVTTISERFTETTLETQVRVADVVVDCTDNFATRFAINTACVHTGTPWVSGAAIRFSGQITVFLPNNPESPCYRCLYTDEVELAETCTANGVIAPLVGVIGSMQAIEVLKIILNTGQTLCGKLLLFEALTMEWRTVKIRKDPLCPVCSAK